jgi:DNA modification methylase
MKEFEKEFSSVWSFPIRDSSYYHNSRYPGNFSPQTVRNLILSYTEKNETVLDPMAGGGTTLIESKLLNRNCIAIDINPKSIELCNQVVNFNFESSSEFSIKCGDARNLEMKDDSVDFIILHPPYFNIIKYSNGKIDGDISNYHRLEDFLSALNSIAAEAYRVLKPGRYCALLIGDTRIKKHYVPLSVYSLMIFLKYFILKEEIIKVQHNCQSTSKWKSIALESGFYLIMHEHLYIFRKLQPGEKINTYKYSSGLYKNFL